MPVIKKLSVQKNNESLPTEYDIGANAENINQDENTSLKNKVNSKQDILIAGENIIIGADGKTISATGGGGGGTTVVPNPAGEPTEELNSILIGETIYDVVSGEELESAVETLQENFQDGVDSIYDACVSKGSTPASHSLADVVDAIDNIDGGGIDISSLVQAVPVLTDEDSSIITADSEQNSTYAAWHAIDGHEDRYQSSDTYSDYPVTNWLEIHLTQSIIPVMFLYKGFEDRDVVTPDLVTVKNNDTGDTLLTFTPANGFGVNYDQFSSYSGPPISTIKIEFIQSERTTTVSRCEFQGIPASS